MTFMSSLKALIVGEETCKDKVILLIKLGYRDGTSGEERVVVRRDQIQQKCDYWAALDGVREVWVYQKIFHHVKITDDTGPNAAIGLIAAGAFGLKA